MNHSPNPESPLLTTVEACTYLKVSRSTLYRMMADGSLKPVRLMSRKPMFLRSTLDCLIGRASRNGAINAK